MNTRKDSFIIPVRHPHFTHVRLAVHLAVAIRTTCDQKTPRLGYAGILIGLSRRVLAVIGLHPVKGQFEQTCDTPSDRTDARMGNQCDSAAGMYQVYRLFQRHTGIGLVRRSSFADELVERALNSLGSADGVEFARNVDASNGCFASGTLRDPFHRDLNADALKALDDTVRARGASFAKTVEAIDERLIPHVNAEAECMDLETAKVCADFDAGKEIQSRALRGFSGLADAPHRIVVG